MGVILAVALAGATFYGVVNGNFIREILGRTLGPYSDSLAGHVFERHDPETLQKIATVHRVAIVYRPAIGEPIAVDEEGRFVPADAYRPPSGRVQAHRTAPDGARLTLYWNLSMSPAGHFLQMGSLAAFLVLAMGSAFWFLQRQLRPLESLQAGVEAVSRGDFDARVPVVRRDEIGQVAGAFNEMAGKVGSMMAERERLLADVSHELRSPIARMKVALELMPEGDKRDLVARDLREMESLIGVLLERQKLNARAGSVRGAEVDMEAVVREVAESFEGRPPGIRIDRDGEATVHADPALMKLLVRNLVDNALKFSLADSGQVTIRLRRDGARFILAVEDDGIGIPPGCEERILEPFVKLDRARGHHAGYGLGLNLCQRIVQLHGGTIRLSARRPRGTQALVALQARGVAGAGPRS